MRNTLSSTSSTALSGVDAPLVTPATSSHLSSSKHEGCIALCARCANLHTNGRPCKLMHLCA